jgi:hypothetical protein
MSSFEHDDRREFLKTCGKFCAVTPPTITMLLSTSLTSSAIASSGGRGVHEGWAEHHHHEYHHHEHHGDDRDRN